jgi:mediator of RNA polymerase II transcription subunit 12, fungi type
MQYLGDILEGSLTGPDTLSGFVERAGEVLRFLAHIAQMLRGGTSTLPSLNSAVQDKFIRAVQLKFSEVEFFLSAPPAAESATQRHQANQAMLFLARLLHFDLGFSGVWTSATREISPGLCLTLLRLALASKHLSFVSMA